MSDPSAPRTGLERLQTALQAFVKARDWEQFHSPKNLALCLSVEASELLELYLWRSEGAPPFPPGTEPPARERVEDEVADVLISLLNFCAVTQIDPIEVSQQKLKRLSEKYPVEQARGSALKASAITTE